MVIVEPRPLSGTVGLSYAFGDTATGTLVADLPAATLAPVPPAPPA
jgi:hypothetical protein